MSATATPQLREAQSLALATRIDPGLESKLSTSGDVAGRIAVRLGFESPAAALSAIRTATAEGLRGYSLMDLACQSIGASQGITEIEARRRFMTSPGQFMAAAFSSSSDFPLLLDNTANKVLLARFEEAKPIWPMVARRGEARDYKPASLNSLSEAPNFQIIPEGGRPDEGTFNERRETIQVDPFGRQFSFTYQMLRNDDLRAFADWAEHAAIAARRVPDDALVTLLQLNSGLGPTMSDGKTMFHADHKNIGVGAALSSDSAKADWLLMEQQKGFGKDHAPLGLMPAVMLVPSDLRWTAEDIAGQEFDLSKGDKMQRNVIRGRFNVASSPRLTSATRWWWLASPATAPAFEVRFLDGREEPLITMREDGDPMSRRFQATLLGCGVAAVQWEAATTNAGTGG